MRKNYEYPEGKAEKIWQLDDIQCSLVRNTTLTPSHYCGYARFPERPVREQGYDGILTYVAVHGGITYARESEVDDTMVYGFDCGHAGDDNNPQCKDIEWLTKETEKMAEIIKEMSKIEYDYLNLTESEDRVDLIDEFYNNHKWDFNPVESTNFGVMLNLLSGDV